MLIQRKRPMKFPCCIASAQNYECDCRARKRVELTTIQRLEGIIIDHANSHPKCECIRSAMLELREKKRGARTPAEAAKEGE